MTPEAWGLLVAVLLALWARHEWHVSRYPDRACSGCGGSGKATSEDMLGRPVIGTCRTCKGLEPTTPRRRWNQ
ncbi:MAG: hypothetical protein GEU83_11645 [Pseudonocardiaceae bacterium]|nr:hypothetical protein [Pseudonocardiaceae bacterium]